MNLAKVARVGVLVAAGYVSGRCAKSIEIDRTSPVDLRALANDVERRQQHFNLTPRRSPSFSRRRVSAGAP